MIIKQEKILSQIIDPEDGDMDGGTYIPGKGIKYPTMNTTTTDADAAIISVTSGDTISLSGLNYANGTMASSPVYTVGTGISNPWTTMNQVSGKIKLEGKDADIEVNGKSLIAMIKRVEERLNILTPNDELEEEWEELRALGNRYRELEKHILDKQATWDKLKAMPPPEIT